jgi:DMSO/TMAO reductase YedYZ molybdopterin-dependent catalytic subunit
MWTRRQFITGTIAAATAALGIGNIGRVSVESWLLKASAQGVARPGTPYPLVALPTKGLMGQVYDLPPNYETPTTHLLGEKNYPLTDNEYYYVRYREPMPPKFTEEDFTLRIVGDAIDQEYEFTLQDLKDQFPIESVIAVGECSGMGRGLLRPMVPGLPWTKGDLGCAEWTGVQLKAILEHVGIDDRAKFISLRSGASTISPKRGDYVRTYKAEQLMNEPALLAFEQNGEPLNFWNGYPLRLVSAGNKAPRWVKQLVEIDIRTTEDDREWSQREIGNSYLQTKSLITTPPDGTEVTVGETVKLKGIAFDKGIGIEKVEVSLDEGKTWAEAELEESIGQYAWRVFNAEITAPVAGPFKIFSRATNAEGETQPVNEPPETWDASGRNAVGCDTFASILVGVEG